MDIFIGDGIFQSTRDYFIKVQSCKLYCVVESIPNLFSLVSDNSLVFLASL